MSCLFEASFFSAEVNQYQKYFMHDPLHVYEIISIQSVDQVKNKLCLYPSV